MLLEPICNPHCSKYTDYWIWIVEIYLYYLYKLEVLSYLYYNKKNKGEQHMLSFIQAPKRGAMDINTSSQRDLNPHVSRQHPLKMPCLPFHHDRRVLVTGVEPATYWLQVSCAANCATPAEFNLWKYSQPLSHSSSCGLHLWEPHFSQYFSWNSSKVMVIPPRL